MLTDFVCVKDPSSNQAALVFADKAKDGKQDVQCVVKTNTSTDCYFMPDLAACNTFRDSKQSMLAIHCSSTFCAKVPTLLQTASAATTTAIPSSTSKTCMQNKTVWTCSSGESSNATLVVLIGIMNDNVMCAADSSSGACKLFYSADNCMANCNAVLSDVAFSSKACQGSITSGISCDGGIISSTNTTTVAPDTTSASPMSTLPLGSSTAAPASASESSTSKQLNLPHDDCIAFRGCGSTHWQCAVFLPSISRQTTSALWECNEGTMTQGVGTCRWMAPEVLEGNRYTVAADIYSFGMVLVELDTHLVPYMQLREVSNFVMMERLREGSLAPEVLDTCPPAINSLLRKCIAWDPLQRPSGAEVAATLRLLVGKL
ncbi:hypothetical protein Ae201684P_015681 [Aphanomyces euteiches]|nr:hypothetical protein Ae201684P_015681 [Aphanomyces euteiches]